MRVTCDHVSGRKGTVAYSDGCTHSMGIYGSVQTGCKLSTPSGEGGSIGQSELVKGSGIGCRVVSVTFPILSGTNS